jgi:hypothetical protein
MSAAGEPDCIVLGRFLCRWQLPVVLTKSEIPTSHTGRAATILGSCKTYLPLEDLGNGDLVTFVTNSTGGRIAIEILTNRFAKIRMDRKKRGLPDLGLPTVKLAVASFPTSDYGPVPRPDFPIVGWEHSESEPMPELLPALSKDMDDNFPF